jgi:colanic acid/amylovoran biosynthesis glycosyltransferase
MSDKNILYLIVSAYPFGNRETFLQNEIEVLSARFNSIFIVIPEGKQYQGQQAGRDLPANVSIIFMDTRNQGLSKFSGIPSIVFSSIKEEFQYIRGAYGLKFELHHLKVLVGFSSMAVHFARQLETHILAKGFDPTRVCLYSYWFTYATAGIALMKQHEPAFRAVTRVHGWDCFFDRSPDQYLPLRPWVIQRLDLTAPVSKSGEQYLLNLLGKDRFSDKIKCHYLGTGKFEKPRFPEPASQTIHLVSIAFVDPVKQLEIIADALKQIHEFSIRWTHIGGGAGLKDLMQYSANLTSDQNNVSSFFTGDLSQQEVYRFLQLEQPDALICTSRSEGLPVSMMEAMAHAIPVISVDVGGVKEIVQNQYNGILMPSEVNGLKLASTIREFASLEPGIRRQLKENAYSTYLSKFVAVNNYEKFAREILN